MLFRPLYFKILSASSLIIFISPENAVSINAHVPSPVSHIMLSALLLRIVLSFFTVDSIISSPYFRDSFLVILVHARKYVCQSSLYNFTPISLHMLSVVEHTFCSVALFIVLLAIWVTLV